MAELSPLKFYLVTIKQVTVFSGLVNGTPVAPFNSITWDGGATGTASSIGTSGAPVEGNTVFFGTTAGGRERGLVRLRSWTPSNGSGTAGTLITNENDDVSPNIADDDFITVKLFWQLWDKVPRQDASNPSNIIFFEDFDIAYSQQTVDWTPMAVAGPPGVEFLEAGQAQISFIGDRSYALAPGATLSSFLWTGHGSVEVTSSSQGTEASPVTFTWTTAGQYLVTLKVTDSNGIDHTNYTWAIVIDPADPTAVAYTKFDAISDNFDADQGGGSCNFTVHGVADVSQFPTETLVLHVARGTQTTPTATWPNRPNILYAGYITGNAIRQDPISNTTSFRTVSIDGLMKKLSIYPIRLSDSSNPQNWTQAKDLTVDRVLSYLAHFRSTLSLMTSIRPLNYTAELKSQDFSQAHLFGMFKSLMGDAWGLPISDHQSVLHLIRDFNLQTTTERATATTRKLLHKGIWVAAIDIAERGEYEQPVRKVKWNGVFYPGDGAAAIPLFSEAPGDVMDSWGNEQARSGLILTTQDDLNTRTGFAYSRANQRYPGVSMRFLNDGSFTIVPQEIFPANIEGADNNRGLAWSPDLIPRSIRRSYDHVGGFIDYQVVFEPSVTGPGGITVVAASADMPAKPPSSTGGGVAPPGDPPPTPPAWTQPTVPVAGPAVGADTIDGCYITFDSGASWEERNNLLINPDQLAMQYLIWDPWWFTASRQGSSDPEQVILWGCGLGFVVSSEDAGKAWLDYTPNLSTPTNDAADAPAPTTTDPTYTKIIGDPHALGAFYMIGTWQNDTSDWRGWLYKTLDSGFVWQNIQLKSFITNLFLDNESGNESQYTSKSEFGTTTIDVSMAAAAPTGTYGVEVVFGGSGSGDVAFFGRTTSSANGEQIDISVQVNPSGISANTGDSVEIVEVDSSGLDVIIVRLNKTADGFDVEIGGQDDGGSPVGTISGALDASDWNTITVASIRADTAVSNDGSISATVNGVSIGAISSIDNFDRFVLITSLFLGGFDKLPGGVALSGTIFLDNLIFSVQGVNLYEVRPLAINTSKGTSTNLFVTQWNGENDTLYSQKILLNDLTLGTQTSFGSATEAQINARTFYIVPHAPAFFGTSGLDEIFYVFGRWNDGTLRHISKTIDGGTTFTDIGDSATWSAGWVGAFLAVDTNTLFAFVNGGSRALYRTTDGGTTWTSLSTLPFDVEHGGVSGHPDGRILIINRDTGAAMAAYAEAPDYAVWFDATGSPAFPQAGGGSNAVIWIV